MKKTLLFVILVFISSYVSSQTIDVGVVEIVQPTTIALSPYTTVEVIVKNFGTDSITSISVNYELNNGVPVIMTWSGLLLSGDSTNVVFPLITLPVGQNSICAYTTLAGDSNTFNDQTCINSYVDVITNAPYVDNFEGVDYWLADTLVNQWERGIPSATNITTAHSPVNVWMIDLDSTYDNNSLNYLYSPKFDFIGVPPDSFIFWHNYNTQSNSDGGRIQYSNVVGSWTNMGIINDPNGVNWYNTGSSTAYWSGNSNGWVRSSYKFDTLSVPGISGISNPAQFRFIFQSDSSINNFDGWAIDDFEITTPKMPDDPGVTAILHPSLSTQIASFDSVVITVKNYGAGILTMIPVHYQINNYTTTHETWTGSLPPDSSVNYTFTTTYSSPGSGYSLCAWATGINPTYTYNDTVCKNLAVTPAAYDAGISNIEEPIDTLECYIKVWIKNYGLDTITFADVYHNFNGVGKHIRTWTGTLLPNDSVLYSYTEDWNYPMVPHLYLCVGVDYGGDLNQINDSICKPIVVKHCSLYTSINESEINKFILNQNIPNPTTGTTQISYTISKAGEMRFELINVFGQIMQFQEKSVMPGTHNNELFVGDLPAGVYYYSVIFEGRRLVKKMVISK
ncbi:MAG: T9SS type A sorting domain-containing protein [Saprospiraceae bacterium]|nr:T9SS type A sorting domain-containing protein [Saprospiraceae bacterium]